MGTWGAGLYSDDMALDLRSTIASLARLPFDGPHILDVLRKQCTCADNMGDEEHTIFWLVTADQFVRKGIVCDEAIQRALEIIDSGRDLNMMEELGMGPRDLRARKAKLAELGEKLREPVSKPRGKVLSKPQPLLLSPGSVWCYPTMKGDSRNPYYATAEAEEFVADGWGAMIVLKVGRAFDWLAWYAVAPIALADHAKNQRVRERPTLSAVAKGRLYGTFRGPDEFLLPGAEEPHDPSGLLAGPGTLSKVHFKRIGLELLGTLEIDHRRVPRKATEYGDHSAVADISLSNKLNTRYYKADGPQLARWLRKTKS